MAQSRVRIALELTRLEKVDHMKVRFSKTNAPMSIALNGPQKHLAFVGMTHQ
jgi:hypothetical protein